MDIDRGDNMTVREYAETLLKECGCRLDCYKGELAQFALDDLKVASRERNIPFPLEDVSKALIEIGNEQPDPPRKGHKRFCMIFDVGHTVDGIEFDTFEEAKNDAIYTLENWIVEGQIGWAIEVEADGISVIPHPTEKQIQSWNRMVNTCCVYVVEWDDETGQWQNSDDAWWPSHEIENEINWLEWEQLKKKYNW